MSKVTSDADERWIGLDFMDRSSEYYRLLNHTKRLEEAMTILIDTVKSEKPNLSLVRFEKLLD